MIRYQDYVNLTEEEKNLANKIAKELNLEPFEKLMESQKDILFDEYLEKPQEKPLDEKNMINKNKISQIGHTENQSCSMVQQKKLCYEKSTEVERNNCLSILRKLKIENENLENCSLSQLKFYNDFFMTIWRIFQLISTDKIYLFWSINNYEIITINNIRIFVDNNKYAYIASPDILRKYSNCLQKDEIGIYIKQ